MYKCPSGLLLSSVYCLLFPINWVLDIQIYLDLRLYRPARNTAPVFKLLQIQHKFNLNILSNFIESKKKVGSNLITDSKVLIGYNCYHHDWLQYTSHFTSCYCYWYSTTEN